MRGSTSPKACSETGAAAIFCVRGIEATSSTGTRRFIYVGEDLAPGTYGLGRGGVPEVGLPSGGADTYWRDQSTGARYLLHIASMYDVTGTESEGYRAISLRTDIEISRVGISAFAANKWKYSGDLRSDTRFELDMDTKFTLDLSLPKNWGGFTAAKISGHEIRIQELSTHSNLTISGKPIGVSGSTVYLKKPSPEWDQLLGKTYPFTENSGGPSLYPMFYMAEAARVASGDKASGLQTLWSAMIHQSNLWCGKAFTNFPGSSSSNALFQSASVPQYKNGFFELTVADFHYRADDSVNRGIYKFSINSKLARCLYRLSSKPITAQVSVTNEKGAKEIAVVRSYESGGNFYVEASNFTFSKKKIRVKISQKK